MKYLFPVLLFILVCQNNFAQGLYSYEHLDDLTIVEIQNLLGAPASNDVSIYKVNYSLINDINELDSCSGLVILPQSASIPDMVIYQHGTTNSSDDVPSNLAAGFQPTLAFAGRGFVCAASDYLGMGDSEGFHKYIHAASEAAAGKYMITAAQDLMDTLAYTYSNQLFITGYSQGGHASMALHRELELNPTTDTVTAAVHMSGPYSIGDVMRNLIISDEVYLFTGYIPYTILSFQEAYGNLYTDLDEIFIPGVIPAIEDFYNGNTTLQDLSVSLAFSIALINLGQIVPKKMLQPSIIQRITDNDPTDPIIMALRDNDVYNWSAQKPTRLYYCTADDQVPFENTILADSIMNANGSADLFSIDINPNADHGGCAVEAIPEAIDFFKSFQNVGLSQNQATENTIKISPNPARDFINIELPSSSIGDVKYVINNVNGQRVQSGKIQNQTIGLSNLANGMYVLNIIQEQSNQSQLLLITGK